MLVIITLRSNKTLLTSLQYVVALQSSLSLAPTLHFSFILIFIMTENR